MWDPEGKRPQALPQFSHQHSGNGPWGGSSSFYNYPRKKVGQDGSEGLFHPQISSPGSSSYHLSRWALCRATAWLPSLGRASLRSEDGLIKQITLIALTMGKMSFSPRTVPLTAVTQVGKSQLPSWSCSSAHRDCPLPWKSEGNTSQSQKKP